MKIGAAFNLLLKGVPSVYYSQEIGMAISNSLKLTIMKLSLPFDGMKTRISS